MNRPLFPPNTMCLCGCLGGDHREIWDGPTFKGTRCVLHGGHKFQPALPAGAAAPPTPS